VTARPTIVLEALSVREQPTGVAGAVMDLVRALAARDRGFDFVIAAASPAPFAEVACVPHWRVVHCPGADSDLRRPWFIQRGLPAFCRGIGADLLHSLQLVAPARTPCPLVVTVHDLAWRELPGMVPRSRRLYYGIVVPAGLRRARLLLASSTETARHLAADFPGTAPRVRVTPLGTPTWILEEGEPVAPAPPVRPFLLFVGTREPRKNLPRLLDAYEKLLAERGDAAPDLRLVGPAGWLMGPLDERLGRPSLRERVTVQGYCDRPELRRLYATAEALVFPSLSEGFGLPVLEAMACGLPVLTSNRGALAEVAGDDALLVDPLDVGAMAEALGRLVADGDLRDRLRRGGPERARQWDWARTADLTAAAYEEILGGPGRRK
jgi:glycosyltransferase involved in cell wall biosynthesis